MVGAGALAGIAAVVLFPMARRWNELRQNPRAQLTAIAEELSYRPFAPRFSGAFPFRPMTSVRRTTSDSADPRRQWKVLRVLAELHHTRDTRDLRVSGVAHAFLDDPERAVSDLERALQSDTGRESQSDAIERTGNATLLVDLAAAYFLRAEKRGNIADYLVAISAADRASTLDPTSAEALWNRCLIVERLGLIPEAREEWSRYIAHDSHSPWADEARQRLARMQVVSDADAWAALRPSIDRAIAAGDAALLATHSSGHTGRLRSIVDRETFPQLVAAAMQGDHQRVRTASYTIALIGEVLSSIHGDHFAADLADAIEGALQSDLRAFAKPHAEYFALESARAAANTNADPSAWAAAARRLEEVQSPFALTVRVQLAGALFTASRFEEVLDTVSEAADRWPLHHYRTEEAQLLWLRGLAHTSLGQIDEAARAYEAAHAGFKTLRDRRNTAAVEMLIAEAHEQVGHYPTALSEYSRSIAGLDRAGDSRRAILALTLFGRAAMRHAGPGSALFIQHVVIQRLRQSNGQEAYLADALITRCRAAAQAGRMAEARLACNDARAAWNRVPDAASRAQLRTDLFFGLAAVADSKRETMAHLDRAIEAATERRDDPRLAQALLLRARTRPDPSLARHDLETAISVVERRRSQLSGDMDRISYFDTVDDLYRELTRALLRVGDAEAAFAVVERSRARVLLEQTTKTTFGSGTPLDLSEVLRRMPGGVALVTYWVDGEFVNIWVLRDRAWQFRRSTGRASELNSDVASVLSSLPRESGWDIAAAKRLGQRVLEPIEDTLAAASSLVIIGDGALREFPFALLPGSDGAFLVERFPIVAAPSATVYLRKSELPPAGHSSAVLIADPELPAGSTLPRLEFREELDTLEASFPSVQALLNRDATPSRVIAAAERADALHFAVHATDADGGFQPTLYLGPDETHEDGRLRAVDIQRGTVKPGATVVLAACRTARGTRSTEGVLSLTRAYLAAGARSVVSSYWDVPDETAGIFFRTFYAALKKRPDPFHAVRAAQLALLKDSRYRSPYFWASYQAHGGS